ncbi:hypothetical protein [Candidatus Rhodobacter oscarellae]|nr:hypothetical protein [Candidatus Rhodobacter lobularis]
MINDDFKVQSHWAHWNGKDGRLPQEDTGLRLFGRRLSKIIRWLLH